MRKKQWAILSILLLIIFVFLIYSAFSSATPGFEAAKKLALAGVPDKDGDYMVGKKTNIDVGPISYAVGYFPSYKIIAGCILNFTRNEMLVVTYDEEADAYVACISDLKTGKVLAIKEIKKDQASEIIDNILKQLSNIGIKY
jgi:hypothetical protein